MSIWYMVSKIFQLVYLNLFHIGKTLLNTKRRIWLRGEFCLSQRKSIWNRGRKFQILKMLLKILFICLWLFAKELWIGFTKEFAKTKHVVQAWSKMLNKKETIHAYLVSTYIGSIPSNLYTYIMQTSSIMHFYICFGLCWHQSPKRGRLKGN